MGGGQPARAGGGELGRRRLAGIDLTGGGRPHLAGGVDLLGLGLGVLVGEQRGADVDGGGDAVAGGVVEVDLDVVAGGGGSGGGVGGELCGGRGRGVGAGGR